MSPLLLDSHILLWYDTDPGRLPRQVVSLIRSTSNPVYVSAASAYELGVKFHRGRLPEAEVLARDFEMTCRKYEFGILQVRLEDMVYAANLEWLNGDPFDRLVATHAIRHQCRLVTADAAYAALGKLVQVVWE